MCLPMIGAAIGAIGSIASASAQSSSYKAQAKFAERQSALEQKRGAYDASRAADINDRRLAQMRGQFLSSGIALEGSPVDVLTDSATEASLDEQAIKFGAKIRSDNLAFEAKMAKMNAKSAMVGGFMGAASSLIGGLTQSYQSKGQENINRQAFEADKTFIRNPYAAYGSG